MYKVELDLVFLLDCTSSMSALIASAKDNIERIVADISQEAGLSDGVRFGLIAYRDHPPQDHTFVTRVFPFTCDVQVMHQQLSELTAQGGGDGPEAVTAAMDKLLELEWRPTASKMACIIADAPPHGIEARDGFPDGSPDGLDPLMIARQLVQQGIPLFVVAAEPNLSYYHYAVDFFTALSRITAALILPLTSAHLLTQAIIGSALEQLDMDEIIRKVGDQVGEKVNSGELTVDEAAEQLSEQLAKQKLSIREGFRQDIYADNKTASENVNVFMHSSTLAEAKPQLKPVEGSRYKDTVDRFARAPPSGTKYKRCRADGATFGSSMPAPAPAAPPSYTSKPVSLEHARRMVTSSAARSARPADL